ncbi:acyloxyacyl hydrolase [Shewanella sp. UCD-KL12]|uniref:acyloxyacyl hydrolase n=1 Tax=Shewanella sp. UCD-KL12 TaxID=1917163 RepID=UPI0009708463|nr:acyloxyacyl hydrolase [Shewanella sp. UCD-KL12]
MKILSSKSTFLGIIALLLFSHASANAASNIRCLYSTPTTKQNIDIEIAECSYLHKFSFGESVPSLSWYPVFNLGTQITDNDNGLMLGAGGGFGWQAIFDIEIFIEGGMYWLEEYEYGIQGLAYKDYGGPWQYFGKLGAGYHFTDHWSMGYAYLHVSNGGEYDINPSFDGHSVYLQYQF